MVTTETKFLGKELSFSCRLLIAFRNPGSTTCGKPRKPGSITRQATHYYGLNKWQNKKRNGKEKKRRKKHAVIQNVVTYTDLVYNKEKQKRRRRIYSKGKGLHHLHLFLLFDHHDHKIQ